MNQVTRSVLKLLPQKPLIKFVFGEPVEHEILLISWTRQLEDLPGLKISEVERKQLQQAIKSEFGKTFSNFEVFFRDNELFIVTGRGDKKYYIEFDRNLNPELEED